jgi:Cd2+/Zn2+-exporting ATPase
MTVDVFDVNGRSRAFRSKNKALNSKLLSSKLCFSTHGAGGDNIDGMLTYCFNGKGEHGEPDDEVCPCGEEEPHLHAHIHNPEACSSSSSENDSKGRSSSSSSGGGNAAKQNANNNWRFLSQLTLHLVDDDNGDDDNSPNDGLANLPINSSMPKQCNASTLQQHLSDKGLQIPRRECCNSEEKKNECDKHRKFPVRHEDHTDYLVHNEASGQLHMEHPCVSCGDNDIHGRFRLLHTRSWVGDETSYQNKGKEKAREIRLHFFEAHPEPFHLLDVFSGLFELESSRVHAVRPVEVMERRPSSASTVELSGPQRGKSQFFVEKICCASEANQIKSLLKKKHGISDVNISTTAKTVYVDHDFDLISANDVASILNAERFGAHVKKDAALQAASKIGIPTDVYVHSTFGLSKVLDGLTVDEQQKTANSIKCCLEKKFINGEIKDIKADVSEQILSIEHRPYFLTASGIVDVLDSYVYEVNIIADGGSDGLWALKLMGVGQEDAIDEHKTTVRPTVVLSGIFWIISMFSLIGGNWDYLKYVALLSVVFGLPPIALKAYRTLRRCHFDVNCMMLLAVLGALPLQEYTESAAVCFLFSISEALESRATARARNALSAIVCLKPEHANVINPYTKAIVVLPASAVAVGSLVSVRPGDKVPCDGKVVEGESHVDESTLTGESRPVSKAEGMNVSGGTINIGNSQLVIKTTATSESSAVSRLIRLVEEAQSNRSETEKMVDTFAKIYTPFVVLAALCMCTIPWAISYDVGILWTKNALVTIVIACPCALIISTPVTYVAGLTAAAQKGVIVKGGQHLESLGRTKSIAFDKTGTLSEGVFQLLELRVTGKRSRREVLEYLALMEAPASHPLSEAIVKGAANEDVTTPKHLELKNHTLLPGEGITALVNGKEVYVGNKKLFQRLGMYHNLPKEHAVLVDEWANAGATTGFISIDGEGIIGSYCVADKIRAESKQVLQDLKKRGIEVTMLTGDLRPAALGIGNQIGIGVEFIKSELLPEDKLTAIQNKVDASRGKDKWWKTKRAVMMVGDGVNDAPALAIADISVAMGEGAALAMETSDVTLMDSDLRKLSWVIHMGKRVIRIIAVNIAFSLIVKGLVGGFMLAGRGSLWAAIASDVGAMLIVTLNGMRLLPSTRKKNDLEIANGEEDWDVVEKV